MMNVVEDDQGPARIMIDRLCAVCSEERHSCFSLGGKTQTNFEKTSLSLRLVLSNCTNHVEFPLQELLSGFIRGEEIVTCHIVTPMKTHEWNQLLIHCYLGPALDC